MPPPGPPGASVLSRRLFVSYILDWLVFVIFVVVAFIFNARTPRHHAFSLVDLSISYPLVPDTVPVWLAAVVAIVVPAVLIVVLAFAVTPGRAIRTVAARRRILRLQLWEWHAGWLGLAMSVAAALVITTGLKNFGKPRPNMLARCRPDLSAVGRHTVGGDGQDISARWAMVTVDICRQPDTRLLNDGFQSWPSGHSAVSWAGLLYLALFMAAKLSAKLPQTRPPRPCSAGGGPGSGSPRAGDRAADSATQTAEPTRMLLPPAPPPPSFSADAVIANRDESAGAPAFLLLTVFVPCGGALYISMSRYMDYAHHGVDILSGSMIGIACAYLAFRWYHPPLGSGSGWAWGPRPAAYAFGAGPSAGDYVEPEIKGEQPVSQDIELGRVESRQGGSEIRE